MASTILADNGASSGSAGIKTSADSTGVLALQTTTSGGTATTAVTIDTSQNVGIGVSPSASNLKMLQGPVDFVISSANSGLYLANNAYYNSGWKYAGNNTASRYAQDSGVHKWDIASSGTKDNSISFTQAMTLDASGNLGVGTTSPGGDATNRQVTIKGTTAQLSTNNGTFSTNLGTTASLCYLEASGANPLVFYTNSSERARIDSSGNLLVGTTSSSAVTTGGIILNMGGGESYTMAGHKTGTTSGSYFHACYYNNTLCGGLTQSGTTGVVLTSISDYRLKEDVLPMQDSLSKVMALNPVSYKWKSDGSEGEGFIAHELQAVIPTAATGTQDEVDEDGNAKYQGINLSAIVPHLVKAIQEQQAIITQLQAEVAALKGA